MLDESVSQKQFWKTTPLEKLNKEQWESLCDGCGKCCVLKLEDADTGEIHYTDVGCKLLDCQTAKCTKYIERKQYVPDCVLLTPNNLSQLPWMPESCAYKLIYENKELPPWHPLMTGNPNSTLIAGQSVATRVVPENTVDEDHLTEHIKDW